VGEFEASDRLHVIACFI